MPTALLHPLEAISPVDGRYCKKTRKLKIFGEGGLIHCRILVELRYLRAICKKVERPLSTEEYDLLVGLETYDLKLAERVKEIEQTTNHDVKAVEVALGEVLAKTSLADTVPWIHNGLTSEDTNNLSYALALREGVSVLLPLLDEVSASLGSFARANAGLPMLARTHGQPATPTTLGKEFAVFEARVDRQIDQLRQYSLLVKLNGASGNWNAHAYIADCDWVAFSETFIGDYFSDTVLPFVHNRMTTQVESHDTYAELFAILGRICTILISFCQDVWRYISDDWLKLKVVQDEVGSSTMPHKVNPIDFENAEGNMQIASVLLEGLSRILPIMRLQRHLSDCTIIRNNGVAFAHIAIALQSILRGMGKIESHVEAIQAALRDSWELLAEPIQVAMRRYRCGEDAYTQLKELTRGTSISQQSLHRFIRNTELPDDVKMRLCELTPSSYVGYAGRLALGQH